MTEAMEEMNWDVEQWLLLLPNPRTPEAKAMLRETDHWMLLSTCDHDGVVSSYRMLKGLVESRRPRLALSVLDASDDAQNGRIYQKLSSVCQQFLDWPLEAEPAVQPVRDVSEHLVLLYRPTHDKSATGDGPAMDGGCRFPGGCERKCESRDACDVPPDGSVTAVRRHGEWAAAIDRRRCRADFFSHRRTCICGTRAKAQAEQASASIPISPAIAAVPALVGPDRIDHSIDDVIDLPGQDVSGRSILEAVLRKSNGSLIECPLRPPMCVEARLAVGRDRGIILLVAASQGLSDLRSISQAYRWLMENRELICMALPQFAIDSRQTPRLRLLVDRADLAADALHPMLQSEHVTIQSYRKLRWGERLGVFLEAA